MIIANSNLVPLGDQERFDELEAKGLMMFGQMTAGSWIYIGFQGILQNVRDLRQCGSAAFRRHTRRYAERDRWLRRYGWCPAAGDHDERARASWPSVPGRRKRVHDRYREITKISMRRSIGGFGGGCA